MPALQSFDSFLFAASRACLTPIAIFFQIQIDRGKDIGPVYTDLSGKHVSGKRGLPPKTSFISSLARSIDQWRQPKKYDV